jgi:hypothetical protein
VVARHARSALWENLTPLLGSPLAASAHQGHFQLLMVHSRAHSVLLGHTPQVVARRARRALSGNIIPIVGSPLASSALREHQVRLVQQFVIVAQLEQAVFLAHAEIAPSENITKTLGRPFANFAAREHIRILLVHESAPLVLLEHLSPHMERHHAHPAPSDSILHSLSRRRALTARGGRIQIRLVRRSAQFVLLVNSPMSGHRYALTVLLENIALFLGWEGVFPVLKDRTLIQSAQ